MECISNKVSRASYQVQEWEQENPDDVNEVTIEAADLDRREIGGVEFPLPRHKVDGEHQPHADHHVERVEAGHEEIETEHNLGLPRELRFFGVIPVSADQRNLVVYPMLVILN